jgi:cytochrome c oxidase subunit 2
VEVGDPERGREIYETGGGVISIHGCKGCHSLKGYVYNGPSLQGISELAGDRVSGLSAAEYLRQSIVDPGAYVVEDFEDKMPEFLELSEEDIDALVAFLLTQ